LLYMLVCLSAINQPSNVKPSRPEPTSGDRTRNATLSE
jgi:hypothetical protein